MNMRLTLLLLILLLSLPISALAIDASPGVTADSVDDDFLEEDPFAAEDVSQLVISDPLEPVNRGMFWVNDKLYFYLFKPVARGWRVVPEPARISVDNFFTNLATPIRAVNALLQLKILEFNTELHRFLINSTVGVGGLFDPATSFAEIEQHDEDLGQTFGHYGVGSGPYLVLPIFGPSNLRDGIGRIGDAFLSPLPYALKDGEVIALKVLEGENELSLDKDTYEGIKKNELDPYLFIRSAYEQNRAAEVDK